MIFACSEKLKRMKNLNSATTKISMSKKKKGMEIFFFSNNIHLQQCQFITTQDKLKTLLLPFRQRMLGSSQVVCPIWEKTSVSVQLNGPKKERRKKK